MAFLQIEDLYGVAEVIVFRMSTKRYGRNSGTTASSSSGESSAQRDDQPKILASEIEEIDAYRSPAEAGGEISSPAGTYRNGANAQQSLGKRAGAVNAADLRRDEARIHLRIPEGKALEEIIRQLGDIVKRYPGQRRIEVCMEENGAVFAPESGVRPCDDLYQAPLRPDLRLTERTGALKALPGGRTREYS